ncbi:hypothetical protein [Streptomyces gobiensis]|uniref:hypothetical protein n=1 Tax=Streptomyces gobiensis TaxID=2875706 RepID=UPI001E5C41E6|nr:hypothetical protein [Streptomyces gobiensis]UGY92781.1 hypothetical protein test1122_14360 [Streptomyces gobiensis]
MPQRFHAAAAAARDIGDLNTLRMVLALGDLRTEPLAVCNRPRSSGEVRGSHGRTRTVCGPVPQGFDKYRRRTSG